MLYDFCIDWVKMVLVWVWKMGQLGGKIEKYINIYIFMFFFLIIEGDDKIIVNDVLVYFILSFWGQVIMKFIFYWFLLKIVKIICFYDLKFYQKIEIFFL